LIVNNNISPDKNLYYIGSEIIGILNGYTSPIDIIKLYNELNSSVKVNFVLFTYALDWLYMSELIINDKNGTIKKCL